MEVQRRLIVGPSARPLHGPYSRTAAHSNSRVFRVCTDGLAGEDKKEKICAVSSPQCTQTSPPSGHADLRVLNTTPAARNNQLSAQDGRVERRQRQNGQFSITKIHDTRRKRVVPLCRLICSLHPSQSNSLHGSSPHQEEEDAEEEKNKRRCLGPHAWLLTDTRFEVSFFARTSRLHSQTLCQRARTGTASRDAEKKGRKVRRRAHTPEEEEEGVSAGEGPRSMPAKVGDLNIFLYLLSPEERTTRGNHVCSRS